MLDILAYALKCNLLVSGYMEGKTSEQSLTSQLDDSMICIVRRYVHHFDRSKARNRREDDFGRVYYIFHGMNVFSSFVSHCFDTASSDSREIVYEPNRGEWGTERF